MRALFGLLVPLVAASACAGRTIELGDGDQGLGAGANGADAGVNDAGGGATADASVPETGDSSAASGLPKCETPYGPVHQYTSVADTEAQIAGTWLLCSGKIQNAPADTAGLRLEPGKATFLKTTGTALVAGFGWDYERDVEIIDGTVMNGPGWYQLNIGTGMFFSRTSEDGRFFELSDSGQLIRFVRVNPSITGVCGVSGAPHVYTSTADVKARLRGRWELCSGSVWSPTDTKGIEFDGNTHQYLLVDSNGSLARGWGWDYERDVAIIDSGGANPGWYQIDLTNGAGMNTYQSRISENGDSLELDEGTSGKKAVYRRIP